MDAYSRDRTPKTTPWPLNEAVRLNAEALDFRWQFEEAVSHLHLSARERECIRDAVDFTERLDARKAPRKDGSLPICHKYRVGLKLAGVYRIPEGNVIEIGVMHDTVEDHTEALARLSEIRDPDPFTDAVDFIYEHFGLVTGNGVKKLSKRPNGSNASESEKIRDYVGYVGTLTDDIRTLVVKCADVGDNVRHPSPKKAERRYSMKKYAPALDVLIAGAKAQAAAIDYEWGKGVSKRILDDLYASKALAHSSMAFEDRVMHLVNAVYHQMRHGGTLKVEAN